ncbi:recombinase family protein [Sporolactobacillus shoreicorticis]|nr:recombinase family protein [Sporolactobacillus shoreicorticis]
MFNRTELSKEKITPYNKYPYIVYGRVSTEKDEQVSSLENQIDICHNWLDQHHFEWNESSILLDDGISGTTILARKAMRLILEKARKREIRMVLFKSISRLARDLKDALEIKEVLISARVRVITIEEGYDSLTEGKNDMKFEMFSMFAAQYPKSISVSTSAAFAAKIRRGEYRGGKTAFGYKIENKKLAVNEEEAKVVRMIFDLYNHHGLGQKNIMYRLNKELAEGTIVGPRFKDKWQLTTVQRILKNPTYCGVVVSNRYEMVKINGRKKQIQNPPEKWHIYYDQHPKIIPTKEWQKANSKTYKQSKKKITPWNELRGLAVCSECGSNMVIETSYYNRKKGGRTVWSYLRCSAYRRAGKYGCVKHDPIPYNDFRNFIIERLKEEGRKIQFDLKNNLDQKRGQKIELLKNQIKKAKIKKRKLIQMYLEDELITKGEFELERQEIAENIKKWEDQSFLLDQETDETVHIKDIKKAFTMLEKTDEDLYPAFQALIEKIFVHPDGHIDIKYRFSNN